MHIIGLTIPFTSFSLDIWAIWEVCGILTIWRSRVVWGPSHWIIDRICYNVLFGIFSWTCALFFLSFYHSLLTIYWINWQGCALSYQYAASILLTCLYPFSTCSRTSLHLSLFNHLGNLRQTTSAVPDSCNFLVLAHSFILVGSPSCSNCPRTQSSICWWSQLSPFLFIHQCALFEIGYSTIFFGAVSGCFWRFNLLVLYEFIDEILLACPKIIGSTALFMIVL